MAIKSATSTSYSEAHNNDVDYPSSSSSPPPGSYPELRVMCNYTSFQDTVAWTFESSETTRDPDLCAQWLEFLRGRIYNGTTQPMSLVVRSLPKYFVKYDCVPQAIPRIITTEDGGTLDLGWRGIAGPQDPHGAANSWQLPNRPHRRRR